jgi:hypothetical protein
MVPPLDTFALLERLAHSAQFALVCVLKERSGVGVCGTKGCIDA